MKKYELTENYIEPYGKKLYQIRALACFGDVKAGEPGGWVESESNLSQEGECWIQKNSKVFGNAVIEGNAVVHGFSEVYDTACIGEDAFVSGTAVHDDAIITGKAHICDSNVYGAADVSGNVNIKNAEIFGTCTIKGDSTIYGGTITYNAYVTGNAIINSDAMLKDDKDLVVFSFGRRNVTFYRNKDGGISVDVGGSGYADLDTIKSNLYDDGTYLVRGLQIDLKSIIEIVEAIMNR